MIFSLQFFHQSSASSETIDLKLATSTFASAVDYRW